MNTYVKDMRAEFTSPPSKVTVEEIKHFEPIRFDRISELPIKWEPSMERMLWLCEKYVNGPIWLCEKYANKGKVLNKRKYISHGVIYEAEDVVSKRIIKIKLSSYLLEYFYRYGVIKYVAGEYRFVYPIGLAITSTVSYSHWYVPCERYIDAKDVCDMVFVCETQEYTRWSISRTFFRWFFDLFKA